MSSINRRANYFIDKRLQGFYALTNTIIAFVIILLIGLEVFRSFFVSFGWPLVRKPFAEPDTFFIAKLLLLVTIGGAFFWLLSAFAGHRIAGPIYRLNLSLKEVANGNYGLRIHFRKNDFFQHVADTFNNMNQSIEDRMNNYKRLVNEVKEKVKLLPSDNNEVRDLKTLLNID